MKIRTKILGGFMLIAVIGMLLGITGLISTVMITAAADDLEQIQVESENVSDMLAEHYIWRQELTEYALDGGAFTGVLNASECALAQWLGSEIAKSITDAELLSLIDKLNQFHPLVYEMANELILDVGESEGLSRVVVGEGEHDPLRYLHEEVLPQAEQVITSLNQMAERYHSMVDDKNEEIIELGKSLSFITTILIIIVLLASVFLALLLTKNIVKPLIPLSSFMEEAGNTGKIDLSADQMESMEKYSQVEDELGHTIKGCLSFIKHIMKIAKRLETIERGDLSKKVEVLSDEDVMGISLERMSERLNDMFAEIQNTSESVSSSAVQLSDGAQSLARASTEQSATVNELSASTTDIAEKTSVNAEMAEKAAILANTIKDNAEKGNQQMDDMMAAVNEITQASISINRVIKVIDDIAFQTNILALNAAVEAARAGQHGKGFSVVAEEVRNLAAKSAEAAKDTGELIANSINKAELGAKIAGETAESLVKIVAGINDSSQIVSQIAVSSEVQAEDIKQINSRVMQVAQIIEQISATAEEGSATSAEMSAQSVVLDQLLSQFKLKNVVRARHSASLPNHNPAAASEISGFALVAN